MPKPAVSNRSKATCLFDHLVDTGEQCIWHRQTERLGSFEIDHQLVLHRRLYRKISRLLALEDAVDVAGGALVLVESGP